MTSIIVHTFLAGDDVAISLELRHANGVEKVVLFFEDATQERPEAGEVIDADSADRIMCPRCNWREQPHQPHFGGKGRGMAMNIDRMGDGCESIVVRTRDRVAEMLREFCSADVTTALHTSNSATLNSPDHVPKSTNVLKRTGESIG